MPPIPPRTPIATAPISVLLTLAGPRADLADILAGWTKTLTALERPYEILLLPLGPVDELRGALEPILASHPHTQVVAGAGPCGIGPALAAGLALAQYPLVCTATADRQFQPEDLPRFLKAIDQVDIVQGYRLHQPVPAWLAGLDLVKRLGVRVLLGALPEPRACWLGWSGWGRRWRARHQFGLRLKDPECPFRLYRRAIFRRIPIQSQGDFAQVEILAKANHLTCLFSEIPVPWVPPEPTAAPLAGPSFRAEAWRVFRDPDFGPAILAAETTTPSPEITAQEGIGDIISS